MIKPEDVSNEMVDQVEKIIAFHFEKWEVGCDAGGIAVAILNAAIEAGIVSPPCYCVRWDGELQMHNRSNPVTGLINPMAYVGKPFSHDTEHYRGQSE